MTDGIEKFEVTDWDLENEFNPNRVRHNLTKKQQIYGIYILITTYNNYCDS